MNRGIRSVAILCAVTAGFALATVRAADLPPGPSKVPPEIKVAPASMRDLGTPISERAPKDKTTPQPVPLGANCGTFWTGWLDTPDADANPCPKNCVRGERQVVKTHKQGDKTLYDARYQCHRMVTHAPPKAEPEVVRTKVIDTSPLKLTGTRFPTRTIDTAPLKLTGTRIPTRTIDTPPLRLTGTRFPTKTIDTPALKLTGTRTAQTLSPRDRAIESGAIRNNPPPR